MEHMSLEFDDKVAILKFNHPEVLNAIGAQMIEDFSEALTEVEDRANGARCLLLTGEGRGFSSGANLRDAGRNEPRAGAGSGLRSSYHPILLRLRDLELPLVTAVNGPAVGVGMSFALMGDLVCAQKDAYFLQAFPRIGLVPDGGSTFMLPRLIGWGRALELSMLAEKLPAEQAHDWGLVNRLFDDNESLMQGSMDLARRLADGPRALALIRRAYWNTWHNAFEQQLDLEARLQTEAGGTADATEGIQAFLEKRPARFKGE